MSAIQAGDVPVTINGQSLVLKCTLNAAIGVNTYFGSFLDAANAVRKRDMVGIMQIISLGVGMDIDKSRELVFANGIMSLVEPVSEYILKLANGGKPASFEDESAKPGE